MSAGKKQHLRALSFLFLVVIASYGTDVSVKQILTRGDRFFDILVSMVPPDLHFASQVLHPLAATLRMSLAGSCLGTCLGLILALWANAYTNPYTLPRLALKLFIHLFRCVPTVLLALMCTFLFGLGTFAGTVAITLSTTAVLARLGYEDMENTDLSTARVLEAAGCSRWKAFVRTGLRQITAGYLTNALYLLEANVRHASILGYVGAGGIGLLLNEKLAWREYAQVGTLLLLLYGLVILTESTSEWLQQIVIGKRKLQNREKYWLLGALAALFLWSVMALKQSENGGNGLAAARAMVQGLLHPAWTTVISLERDGLPWLLYETFCIAFLGTVAGAVLAGLLSFGASFRLLPACVAVFPRAILLLIRTVPVVVYGLMWIRVTGPGPFAGVLTLALCSIGLLARRFLIAIDSIDLRPYEAQRAAGVGFHRNLRWTILPQLLPRYVTAVLYRFDINVREAAVLGLVGAGGLGTPLILAMMHYEWSEAGALLWGMVVLAGASGLVSEKLRK